MPKLSGIFDYFNGVAEIPLENIVQWLKSVPNKIVLENFIANRVLYPQTIPISEYDMEVDMAIVREALKLGTLKSLPSQKVVADTTTKKLYIPIVFFQRIPNLIQLIVFFIDAYLVKRHKESISEDIWTVIIQDVNEGVFKNSQNITIGTVLIPIFDNNQGFITLIVDSKKYQIKQGIVTVIPSKKNHCHIEFQVYEGKMLGVNEGAIEVNGGDVGIIIDARRVKNG